MKIAVSGKGGAGKTTLVSLLGYLFSQDSPAKGVFLIDADPDGNLGYSLGISQKELSEIKPISELKEIIQQRTMSDGSGFFKLNPKVSDIPEKFSVAKDNIRLLVLGTIKKASGGCYCPENAFLRSLLQNLLVCRKEIVIVDMPAGIEHLTRGTAEAVDAILIVVEPTLKSIQTALTIKQLANGLKIKRIHFVGNKISQSENDLKFIQQHLSEDFIGYLSFNPELLLAEQNLIPVYESARKSLLEVSKIKERLEKEL
ncbi:MAG: AAA family ATPase [Elusimicrobiota bacterium]|nr:AAA family ATPase [Elusimicrobiota bacterium]